MKYFFFCALSCVCFDCKRLSLVCSGGGGGGGEDEKTCIKRTK